MTHSTLHTLKSRSAPANPRHLAYWRLFHATPEFRRGASFAALTPTTPCCACCDRRWADVEVPFEALEYAYGKVGKTEYVCWTCYTPRIPSEAMLGLERWNITGKTHTPIYGKLGMLVGSGGIITPENALHLTLPPRLLEKYRTGEWGRRGRLTTEKPLVRLLAMLSAGELDPIGQGFVYIENWGRKVDGLMRYLTPTASLRELWCNSENGVRVLDLHAMILTAEQMQAQGLAAKADRKTFWWPIIDAASGKRDDAAFADWVKNVPDPQALLEALPADPFNRQELPAVLQAIMPCLERLLPYCQAPAKSPPPPDIAAPRQGSLF